MNIYQVDASPQEIIIGLGVTPVYMGKNRRDYIVEV